MWFYLHKYFQPKLVDNAQWSVVSIVDLLCHFIPYFVLFYWGRLTFSVSSVHCVDLCSCYGKERYIKCPAFTMQWSFCCFYRRKHFFVQTKFQPRKRPIIGRKFFRKKVSWSLDFWQKFNTNFYLVLQKPFLQQFHNNRDLPCIR